MGTVLRDQHKMKMSGYLEKKGKLRISSWKKYWFVLEGRLLLYYRSKDEYEAISPCKGSINMGPPCVLKPYPAIVNCFQINTRNTTYTLRAENPEEQQKWMHALMTSLNQNQNFSSTCSPKNNTDNIKLNHFRYSLDSLVPAEEHPNTKNTKLERQNSLPHTRKTTKERIERLQKMGAQSYGGTMGAISKIAKKSPKLEKADSQISISSDGYAKVKENREETEPSENPAENCSTKKRNSWTEKLSGSLNNLMRPKSLVIENDSYQTTKEALYAIPKKEEDHNQNCVLVENAIYASENLYEDLDKFSNNVYSEPIFHNKGTGKKAEKSRNKCKKKQSFIRNVLSKKMRKKDKYAEEKIYEEIPECPVDKFELNDEGTVQLLSELQNILVNKKNLLEKNMSNQEDGFGKDEGKEDEDCSSSSNSAVIPDVPPKTRTKHSDNNSTIQSERSEQVRSLDEILEDLDREKITAQPKNKVQALIDKFNVEANLDDEEVCLRRRSPKYYEHSRHSHELARHSDELTRLLDELVKVTTAPVLPPGATNSLIAHKMTDEELLRLVPVRKRRLSEPDYDVPRSHRSLLQLPKPIDSDAIAPTRFFGPGLLENQDMPENSMCISMTPDSLEIDDADRNVQNNQLQSYTSHNYSNIPSDGRHFYGTQKAYFSVATHIVSTCQNICRAGQFNDDEHTIVYKNVRNIDVQEEVFRDSLEHYND